MDTNQKENDFIIQNGKLSPAALKRKTELEIKMQRILKYNKDKADDLLLKIKAELAEIENDLAEDRDHFRAMIDRKSTRLNSSHLEQSRMPSSA